MSNKISVIIPVYNVEPYLGECLDSVVNQTVRDIQIICVNDGSTDGSLAILREYEARDTHITVLDQPNRRSDRPISIRRLVEEYLKRVDKTIELNLGYYPYTTHEPYAFWAEVEKIQSIGSKASLDIPNRKLCSKN